MNFDRSTDGVSPLRWLNVVQRGGTDDWRELFALCQQSAFARQLAALLQRPDPDNVPACRLWRRLLHDLHPGLFRQDDAPVQNGEIDQPVGSSPAVVDGKVIVGSEDGSVYCFGAKK